MVGSYLIEIVFAYVLAVLVLYAVGNLFLSFFNTSSILNPILIFLRLFTGLVILVSVYSIYITKANTIQLIFPIALVPILLYCRLNDRLSIKQYWRRFLIFDWSSIWVFILFSAVFLVVFQLRFAGVDNLSVLKNPDLYYYGGIADYFNKYGVETNSFEIIYMSNVSPSIDNLYHYFELWFAAVISKIFGFTGVNALMKICFPFFYSLVGLGCYKLVSRNSTINPIFRFLITCLIFFVSPLTSYLDGLSGKIFSIDFGKLLSLMTECGEKLSVPTLFIISSILLLYTYRNKHLFITILPTILLAVIFPTTFPGIIGTIMLFLMWYYIFGRKHLKWFREDSIYVAGFTLISVLFFVLFFKLNSSDIDKSDYINSFSLNINYIIKEENLILLLKNFVTNFIKYFVIELPYILLYFLSRNKGFSMDVKEKWFAVIVLFAFTISNFSMSFLSAYYDSYQFLENLLLSLLFIVHLMILFQAFRGNIYSILLGIIIALISVFGNESYSGYSKECCESAFIEEIKQEVGHENSFFAYRKDTLSNSRHSLGAYTKPLFYINTFNSFYFPIDLGALDKKCHTIKDSIYAYNTIVSSPFARFIKENGVVDMDLARSKFIRKYNIKYLIWHKRLPVPLNVNVAKIISDDCCDYNLIKLGAY